MADKDTEGDTIMADNDTKGDNLTLRSPGSPEDKPSASYPDGNDSDIDDIPGIVAEIAARRRLQQQKKAANKAHNPYTMADKDTKGKSKGFTSWNGGQSQDKNPVCGSESDIDDGPAIALEIAARRRAWQEQKVEAHLAEIQARRDAAAARSVA
jgi:hypothetical protein